jgi:hypothetical protein
MWLLCYQVSDASEEIVKLQNRVAELEEDKGNLQLHLVDFDELKGKSKKFQNKIQPLSLCCTTVLWLVVVLVYFDKTL